MDLKLKKIIKILISVLLFIPVILYPVFVYYSLVVRNIPLRQFSLVVIVFALFAFISGTARRGASNAVSRGKSFRYNALILLGVGILCLFLNSTIILKFYPVIMNLVFLITFGITLFSPPCMIYRFATMQDKSIKGSIGEKHVEAYCYKVTKIWCIFFIFNGSVAAWTIFHGSDALWSIYNGGISYILTGIIFAGEFIVRMVVQKKIPKSVPLSAVKANSRPASAILCYDGTYNESKYKTWGDFLEGTARLRRQIQKIDSQKWLLYCDDYWYFLLAFTALLQCKKEILLSANISAEYIAEIRKGAPFLTDLEYYADAENNFSVSAFLSEDIKIDPTEKIPEINADDTIITMFTSGSTGKSKAVRQRLTEFENDNSFILSKWGEEFLKRKLCSTVNQHHIYGLLFSILLPFTAAVPFRRKRIEFPEEFEKLNDSEYMIITVPAFLKRAVEIEKHENLNLKSPWIFTSGGVLDPQTAKKTNEIFGFWPVEVYGSTETSGIAWRQSCAGLEWTPFDNAQLNVNSDGCLVIRSPYIREISGFETSDIVEMKLDGRFLLKGRLDSVVKIEEKRISLAEMENRIIDSGLVSDVCVISLEDKRQYLAAVIVFNEKGKEYFLAFNKQKINVYWRKYLLNYFENVVIPKKWRYPDIMPLDAQGKKRKETIELLFRGKE